MTKLQKDEYIFSVDIEKTKEYYNAHSLCECVYCRNYYAQAKEKFPQLAAFLNDFGVDVSKPDEIFSCENNDCSHIDYISVDYTVCGKIETMGTFEIDIFNQHSNEGTFISIVASNGFVSPNEQVGEYFTLSVTSPQLPWVLDEPIPKAIPKSNTFKKILNKLFKA